MALQSSPGGRPPAGASPAPAPGRARAGRAPEEARAAATLDHPNIVHVYSVGNERGVYYYAMQLVEGQSMAAVIAELLDEPGVPSHP